MDWCLKVSIGCQELMIDEALDHLSSFCKNLIVVNLFKWLAEMYLGGPWVVFLIVLIPWTFFIEFCLELNLLRPRAND